MTIDEYLNHKKEGWFTLGRNQKSIKDRRIRRNSIAYDYDLAFLDSVTFHLEIYSN
jgi:hypothetical protein